jgi:uncharacterized protein involved in cysteine biosynthesis
MINWKPVAIGFVVTLILEIIGVLIGFWGMFVPLIISILAPVIGGLLAAYIAGGEYIDGARNGGLAGGFGSLVAAFIVLSGADLAAIIFSAIFSFILSAILGIIGGTIGIVLKGKPEELAEES